MLEQVRNDDKLDEVLKELPEDKRDVLISAFYAVARSYSSPLPPPEDFERYEKAVPHSMDRILTLTEKQVDSRIKKENKVTNFKFILSLLGQLLGAALVVLFGYLAYSLAMEGHDEIAKWLGVTTVVSIAVIFVLNKVPSLYDGKAKSQ